MSLNLTIGTNDPISLTSLTDLTSALESNLSILPGFVGLLDDPLSSVPDALKTTNIQYDSGNQSWTLGDFGFTLSGGVTGKLSLISSGDLFSYTDSFATELTLGLDTTTNDSTAKPITVPDGFAYVCVELDLQISGGITGKFTSGIYGVSGSASTSDTFSIAFYKKCLPTDSVEDAFSAAFAGFVLPLHSKTLLNLKAGDYLKHNFNANLKLGVGASIGYDKVFYAGKGSAALPALGAGASAVKLNASVKPRVKANAQLAFSFEYAGAFESILWVDDAGAGHLHLFRSKEQQLGVDFNAGVTFLANASASTSVVDGQLGDFFSGLLPAPLSTAFTNAVWPKAAAEIDKYVGDVNSKITSLLKPFNQAQATLDVAIQKTSQNVLLLDYTFDLGAPAFSDAWIIALKGDFLGALQQPDGGVQLATGSGLEKLYDKKTSVTLNLFGKLNGAWTTDIINNSSLIYAGNNIFHLIVDEGIKLLSTVNGVQKEIELYFATELDLGTNILRPTIDLHCILQATNNPKYGGSIANFLTKVTTGRDAAALAKSVAALAAQPKTTQSLHIVLAPSVYANLDYSTLPLGNPPDDFLDSNNYDTFGRACTDLIPNLPGSLSYKTLTYQIWSDWSIACNNRWPKQDGDVPDRSNLGAIGGSQVQSCLDDHQQGNAVALTSAALHVASSFMNLCQDLSRLATLAADATIEAEWDSLTTHLKHIIANDVPQDFIAPAVLALTRLCGGMSMPTPTTVSGPAFGLTTANSIAITISYS